MEELHRDFGTADKSVLGIAPDRIWLSRVQGTARATFIDPEDRNLEVLRRDWPPVLDVWKKLMAGHTDETVKDLVSFKDMKGNPYQQPLWEIVLHMVNHGTHHRGQASGFLRTMGKTPPPLDLIYYYRQLSR